jgi:hypothetical protein
MAHEFGRKETLENIAVDLAQKTNSALNCGGRPETQIQTAELRKQYWLKLERLS